jgi:hypothetical protein
LAACGSTSGGTDAGGLDAHENSDGGPDAAMNVMVDASGADAGGSDAIVAMDASSDPCAPQTSAFDMTGSWATLLVNAQNYNSALGPGNVTITTIEKFDAVQTGTMVSNTNVEVCSVTFSPYLSSTTTYPASALRAITAATSTATLGGAMTATPFMVEHVEWVGWRPNGDPKMESLPTMAMDPRVLDPDGDGHPGVTIQVQGPISGKVYIVNRNIIDLNGTVMNTHCIKGASHTVQVTNPLGADPVLLASPITAMPDPDASKSTFVSVRLPPNITTCTQIVANKVSLFP